MSNENCLKGIKCPKCGNESKFIIQANAVVTVEDSGVTDAHTFEWGSDDGCKCAACDFHGELSEFEMDSKCDDCEGMFHEITGTETGGEYCANCLQNH